MVERKTGLMLIQRVTLKTAVDVSAALIRLMQLLKAHVTTITSDNRREFAEHETIARRAVC